MSSLGTPSYLLYAAGDRPLNLYLWAAMGMASSVGLGLALAQPGRRVVVLDGDGAALMNLNGLVTVGWRAPANLLWLVLENGVYLETGGQPIATARGVEGRPARPAGRAGTPVDLVQIARGAGLRSAAAAATLAELAELLDRGLREPGPALVVARVGTDTVPDRPPFDPVRLKHRFMDHLLGPSGRAAER